MPDVQRDSLEALVSLYPVRHLLVVGPWTRQLEHWFATTRPDHIAMAWPQSKGSKTVTSEFLAAQSVQMDDVPILDGSKQQTFFISSLASESGFEDPESLKGIWKNIRTVEQSVCDTITLDEYSAKCEFFPNWLILNTLSAERILLYARQSLEAADGVILRRKVGSNNSISVLEDLGFRVVQIIPEPNQEVEYVIYLRAWKEKLEADLTLIVKAHEERVQTLNKQVEAQKAHNDNLRSRIEDLKHQLTAQKRSLSEVTKDHRGLQAQLDAEQQAAQTTISDLEELKKEHQQSLEQQNSEIEALAQDAERASKKERLALNNLEDLKLRHQELAEKYQSQLEQFSQLETQILTLLQELSADSNGLSAAGEFEKKRSEKASK